MEREEIIRLDRLLVSRGFGTRSEVQRLIRRGAVRGEKGELKKPDHRVSTQISLWVYGALSEPPPRLVVYHKPLGILSTLRDPWGRAGLDFVLPEAWRPHLHPVGRLDADTSGLLLFSSDGGLTQRLLHPKRMIPRCYQAFVSALPENLEGQLAQGVETALGVFCATLESVKLLKIEDLRPQGAEEAVALVQVSVIEGKHRMVRRLLHNAGASVLALHRVSYGLILLDDLPCGQYRIVSEEELERLSNL